MKRPEGFDQQGKRNPVAQPPQGDRGQKARGAPSARAPKRDTERRQVEPAATKRAAARPRRIEARQAKAEGGSSRTALRRATRERRRFERAEVRRFTHRTRRRRLAWAGVATIIAAMVAVLGVAVYSPLLALREITVTGTGRLNADDVVEAVSGQLETPLALLDFDRITRELATFTLIRSYVTETVPPDTLVIHIVEREPLALIARGSGYDHVDPAGVVIASSAEKVALPLIETGTQSPAGPSFRAAVDVLLAMPAAVFDRVDTISANTPNDVHVRLVGISPVVVWGGPTDSELKASVLSRLLEREECAAAAVIDVSAPLAPICGPG